jgi:voltage-gated potassium channel
LDLLKLLYYVRIKTARLFRIPWIRIGTFFAVLILITPLVLQAVEPPGSSFSHYFNGVYFTIVTMSTVGFGDISPGSEAGKTIVMLLIICGGAMYAVLIGEGATLVWRRGEAKLRGEMQHRLKDHIVVMEEGDLNGTRELFEEILADPYRDPNKLMYISTHEKNPFHDKGILYTRGERIYDDNVLTRSCIQDAAKVVIKGGRDSDTFFAAEAVVALNPSAEVTAWVVDRNNMPRFDRLKGTVDVIHPLTAQILCQNMQDKIFKPLQSILTNKSGQELYLIHLPNNGRTWDIERLHPLLRQQNRILILAIQRRIDAEPIVNPTDIKLPGGTLLWVLAENRPLNLDWKALSQHPGDGKQ